MGDLESLLLVLAAIYLTECAVWVRRGNVAFVKWWGRTWSLCHPGLLTGNQRGSLLLANPLPPLGSVFIGQATPLSVSPEAAFSYSAACLNPAWRAQQLGRFVRFADFKTVQAEGKKVMVNSELFWKAASPGVARELAGWLRKIQALPVTERGAVIKKRLRDSLDSERITARLEELCQRARPIRMLSNGLFVYLFVIAPVLWWQFGLNQLGWPLAALLLGQTITIAILFRRAHLGLYPNASEERFTPFLTMLLAPPTAIRAPDILARPLMQSFHPLAASQVLCPPRVVRGFARQVLLDLRHPILPVCPGEDPGAAETEQWLRAAMQESIEEFVRRAGLDLEELLAPPTRIEPQNMAYCPRCGAQYVRVAGICEDCGGRSLELFKPDGARMA